MTSLQHDLLNVPNTFRNVPVHNLMLKLQAQSLVVVSNDHRSRNMLLIRNMYQRIERFVTLTGFTNLLYCNVILLAIPQEGFRYEFLGHRSDVVVPHSGIRVYVEFSQLE